jgi:hypothetical protein
MTSLSRAWRASLALALVAPALLHAQPAPSVSPGDLATVRAEMARLREEVAHLRAEVAALKASRESAAAGGVPPPAVVAEPLGAQAGEAPAPDPVVAMLQAQVAEQAQTKVESSSRLPVKIFGTIHASTVLNTGEANWLENPNLVAAPPAAEGDTGSFTSTLRQSRIGVTLDGLRLGSVRASGMLAWDFFGGVPGFQTGPVMGLPRLLYAFSRFAWEKTTLEVGQDEMVLAPRNPTSLAAYSFPDLFRSGNLYLRVPQIRVEHEAAVGASASVSLTGALVAPIGGDFPGTYTFAPPALSGERSSWPAVQGRAAWKVGDATAGPGFVVGVSGHYGQQRRGGDDADSWAGALDFDGTAGRFGAGGELFVGRNVAAFGGAMGQLARTTGGFAEARFAATPRVTLAGGAGLDRASQPQGATLALERNVTGFGNATYHLSPELAASFEYRYLVTTPRGAEQRRNQHLSWVLAYTF